MEQGEGKPEANRINNGHLFCWDFSRGIFQLGITGGENWKKTQAWGKL
jgi:hypothetical protein